MFIIWAKIKDTIVEAQTELDLGKFQRAHRAWGENELTDVEVPSAFLSSDWRLIKQDVN